MTLPESRYRDLFARQYGATTEVRVPFGRVDAVLQLTVGEGRGKRKLRPAVAVYGEISATQARAMRRKLDRLVHLFLLDGVEWVYIEQVAPRRQVYRPAADALILAKLREPAPESPL